MRNRAGTLLVSAVDTFIINILAATACLSQNDIESASRVSARCLKCHPRTARRIGRPHRCQHHLTLPGNRYDIIIRRNGYMGLRKLRLGFKTGWIKVLPLRREALREVRQMCPIAILSTLSTRSESVHSKAVLRGSQRGKERDVDIQMRWKEAA
jgi:hypothetical protein